VCGFQVDNRENNSCDYFDPADENLCNWMMFIRPATVYAEQNLVAYQYRSEIYFSTISDIQPGQELKVAAQSDCCLFS
jgi:PR domain zinc finger protein 10